MSATGAYDAFARRLLEGGLVTDPWLDGAPRFETGVERLDAQTYRRLCRAAEQLATVYDELARLVWDDPELTASFFSLTPVQEALWQASAPLWHGIGRADLFITTDGELVTTELNSDTPTGEAEAVELSRLMAEEHPDLADPNAQLESRFLRLVEALHVRVAGPRTVGLVYPTELTEDLSVVRLYRRWLEGAGFDVVLASPYNLGRDADGRLTLFDVPVSVVVRHYKTDWWTERVSPWLDDPIPDALPLTEPLTHVLGAWVDGKLGLVNPFGSVLTQNKRAMAFMWEHLHRFSPTAQAHIQALVPLTSRLETMHPEQLLADRAAWVLKSDYGAEGDEVIVGLETDAATWAESLRLARPGRWIAQRYFAAQPRDERGTVANYGVFLIAGEAAGCYVRVQSGATDDAARSLAVGLTAPTSP